MNIRSNSLYAFGSTMYGRTYTVGQYRFGFNGKEKDNETYGDGNAYDFGARIYDGRLGRFMSLDPMMMKYQHISPYIYAADNPIYYIDFNGLNAKAPPNLVAIYNNKIFLAWKSEAEGQADEDFHANLGFEAEPNYNRTNQNIQINIPYVKPTTKEKLKEIFTGSFGVMNTKNEHKQKLTTKMYGVPIFKFTLQINVSPIKEAMKISFVRDLGKVIGAASGSLNGKFVIEFLSADLKDKSKVGRAVSYMIFDTEKDYMAYQKRRTQLKNDQLLKLAKQTKDKKYRETLVKYYKKNYPGTPTRKEFLKEQNKKKAKKGKKK